MARKWLETDIAQTYLPALEKLRDDKKGHQEATALFLEMRSTWESHNLKTAEQQYSCLAEVRSAIKANLGKHHWSLQFIAFSTEEHTRINSMRQQRVSDRNEAVQFLVNPDAIVATAVRLLKSPEWSEIAAGLSLLTGRRLTELLSTANFEVKSKWSVTFTGALKRRGEPVELSFEIPTLTTAEKVVTALGRLRAALPETQGLTSQQINRSYGQAVARACDKHFESLIPLRPGKDNLYTHMSRSVYAMIAVFWYCPTWVNETEFKASIQGHYQLLNEENPELRRSIAASRHYSDYEIADSVIAAHQGKRKGIKLNHGGVEVLEAFRKPVIDASALSREDKQRASVRIYHSDKPLLESILDRLELTSGTQQYRMSEFLLWADHQLSDRPLPAQAVPTQTAEPAPLEAKLDKLVDAVSLLVQALPHPVAATSAPAPSPQQKPQAKPKGSAAPASDTPSKPSLRQANTDRLHQAIDAIMAWNNAPVRLHDEKWAITINALKSFVNSQPKIQAILAQRADEISSHHNSHQIDPAKHNLRHRGKRKIEDIIQLPPIGIDEGKTTVLAQPDEK